LWGKESPVTEKKKAICQWGEIYSGERRVKGSRRLHWKRGVVFLAPGLLFQNAFMFLKKRVFEGEQTRRGEGRVREQLRDKGIASEGIKGEMGSEGRGSSRGLGTNGWVTCREEKGASSYEGLWGGLEGLKGRGILRSRISWYALTSS